MNNDETLDSIFCKNPFLKPVKCLKNITIQSSSTNNIINFDFNIRYNDFLFLNSKRQNRVTIFAQPILKPISDNDDNSIRNDIVSVHGDSTINEETYTETVYNTNEKLKFIEVSINSIFVLSKFKLGKPIDLTDIINDDKNIDHLLKNKIKFKIDSKTGAKTRVHLDRNKYLANFNNFSNEVPLKNTLSMIYAPTAYDWKIFIYLTKKFTSTDILNMSILQNDPITETESLNILKILNESDKLNDIITSSITISLLCPISLKRIKYPARSKICNHLECFDAWSFLLSLEQMTLIEKINCPICNVVFDDLNKLCIDQFNSNILKLVPIGIDSVKIDNNGDWWYEIYNDGTKQFKTIKKDEFSNTSNSDTHGNNSTNSNNTDLSVKNHSKKLTPEVSIITIHSGLSQNDFDNDGGVDSVDNISSMINESVIPAPIHTNQNDDRNVNLTDSIMTENYQIDNDLFKNIDTDNLNFNNDSLFDLNLKNNQKNEEGLQQDLNSQLSSLSPKFSSSSSIDNIYIDPIETSSVKVQTLDSNDASLRYKDIINHNVPNLLGRTLLTNNVMSDSNNSYTSLDPFPADNISKLKNEFSPSPVVINMDYFVSNTSQDELVENNFIIDNYGNEHSNTSDSNNSLQNFADILNDNRSTYDNHISNAFLDNKSTDTDSIYDRISQNSFSNEVDSSSPKNKSRGIDGAVVDDKNTNDFDQRGSFEPIYNRSILISIDGSSTSSSGSIISESDNDNLTNQVGIGGLQISDDIEKLPPTLPELPKTKSKKNDAIYRSIDSDIIRKRKSIDKNNPAGQELKLQNIQSNDSSDSIKKKTFAFGRRIPSNIMKPIVVPFLPKRKNK